MSKEDFVEELKEFYMNVVGNQECIVDMHYETENGREYVYVSYVGSGRFEQKRFSVWGDNEQGILIDFAKFLQNTDAYPWILGEDRR